MGNLGGGEIIVILLAALLILGPNKLPDAARQLGRAMGEIRKVTSGFQRELQDAIKDTTDDEAEARKRGEAIAATRPTANTTPVVDPPGAAAANGDATIPSEGPSGSEPVSMHDAAAQIPPAPGRTATGDDVTVAPGSDH
jgi:Tat protein translocase TatB subunit